jgi:hypothetical protein
MLHGLNSQRDITKVAMNGDLTYPESSRRVAIYGDLA